MERKLKLGIPKGSLQEATFSFFKKAGFEFRMSSGRSYHPSVDDPELEPLLIRPQEIPRYVEQGILDAGLTGKDWIEDNRSQVVEVAEFVYSKATLNPIRVVLAAPNGSAIESAKDLEGKRIATEYVRLTERYLEQHGVHATVEFSWGACEVKVPDLVDAIVVNTETGSSLRAHNLKIVDTLLTSTTRFIVNTAAWADSWKRGKVENITLLLRGALNAEQLVGLKMNVACANLDAVTALLPALKNPTISPLSNPDWVALEIIVAESTVRDLLPALKRAGAEGLVEYPLNKVIY
ncbi:MAG TPA: ATP phosphoribosyltransferase [Chthonomonadaceae bacterium]|nr:ATP phosphoribosyltransferase [Chthonomonadaceae bacterium]